jgi:hypothetical protein
MEMEEFYLLGHNTTQSIESQPTFSFETEFQWTTWCCIPEDTTLLNLHCETLESYEVEVEMTGFAHSSFKY